MPRQFTLNYVQGPPTCPTELNQMVDGATFHTYKVVVHDDNTAVFIDGEQVATALLTSLPQSLPQEARLGDVSTSGGNVTAEIDFIRIASSMITVAIDIKPGSDPNCFNNDGHGVIPVAILGSADFDVTQVDPESVQLQGLSVAMRGKSNKLLAHIEDVNGDGFDDLVVQIEDVDGIFTSGTGTATLTGTLLPEFGGASIQGTDNICIVL